MMFNRKSTAYHGGTALITGASSGIGEAFALEFARRGYRLILTGRRREKLESLASSIRDRFRSEVDTTIVELAAVDERERLVDLVRRRADIRVLVNNAGFGAAVAFADDPGRLLAMIDVHIRASLELIAAALPAMQQARDGIIINVSSIASFFPLPRGSVYSASKSFLTVFSRSLAMEVADRNIRVQALCPGMTRTDFHERMGISGREITQRRMLAWMSSEAVVEASLRALRRNRVVCIPGAANRFLVAIAGRIPPGLYSALARRIRK
jgi:uncharacterized protein